MKLLSAAIIVALMLPYGSFSQDTIILKKYFGNLKKVDLVISGKPFSFLFDTGGGETFISPGVVSYLHRTVYGNVTGFRMSGEAIHYQKCDSVLLLLNKTNIFHRTMAVWDIMSVLPKEFPPLDGVLSLESFRDQIITLDLSNNRLIIETPGSFQRNIKRMQALPCKFANGLDGNSLTILLGTVNKNHLYWLLFDSGNLDKLLLSHSVAFEWNLQPDSTTQRHDLGAVSIAIGKKQCKQDAAAQNMIYDGALNYAIISQSVFLINFPQKKIWMR